MNLPDDPATAGRHQEVPMDHTTRAAYRTQLLATEAGRQHLLSISVDAEEGDEGGIFDQLADAVDDPDLRRIVERHRDDEVRHAGLFRSCLARLGLEKQETPDDLRIIRRIAGTTGGLAGGVRTADDIVAVYAMLLAIEERGVEQFPLIADAFRPHDEETAEVYLRVARDERRHVRYCERIGQHYAGDAARWQEMLGITRALEAEAFAAVGAADVAYCTERGWIEG
jgi:rubrerythrin